MSITKFNHVSPFTAKAEKDLKYFALRSLFNDNGPEAVYLIRAIYFNKGQFDEQPIILTNGYYVNLPAHLTADCKEMVADPDVVRQINNGQAGFKIRSYVNRRGGTSYSVEWVDLTDGLPY